MKSNTLLQTKAYDYIKERILNDAFDKDTLYSETKLAKEIGISRTPMREALQCLSQDGYIKIFPSRGFTIRQLSEKDMKETIQVRCAIEGFCTYILARDIREKVPKSLELLKRLEELLTSLLEAKNSDDDFTTFIHYDHEFHLMLVSYVENEEFNHIYQKLMYLIQLTSKSALSVKGRIEETLLEHETFFNYLKQGNSELAYDTLMKHLLMPAKMHLTDSYIDNKN